MLRIIFLSLSLFMISFFGFSQDLSEYKWNNRVLLVLTDTIELAEYKLQLKELHSNPSDLTERRLKIIHVTPNQYRIDLHPDSNWQKSEKLYKTHKKQTTPFEVILIGLDGGIKSRQTAIFTLEDLNAIIDAMPMRSAEIKNEKK